MKKFNFKALVLVVLALVMIFALVACGEETEEKSPTKPSTKMTAEAYFNALEKGINGLGKTAIEETEDLAASIALEVSLDSETITLYLGVELDVIYDRDGDNANSAARVSIIDKAGSLTAKDDAIIELYYFMADPTAIYADICDAKVKLLFDADGNENASLAGNLTNLLTTNFTISGNDLNVDGMIANVASTFGAEFSLDNLVNAIAGEMLGLNVSELIGSVADLIGVNASSIPELLTALSDILVDNEETDITKTTKDGITSWNAKLGGLVKGLLSGVLPEGIMDDNSELAIGFDVDAEGVMDNFKVTASTAPIGLGNDAQVYNLMVAITEFDIKGVTATADAFGIKKADYSEDYVVKASLDVDVKQALAKLTFDELVDDAEDNTDFASICAAFSKDFATVKSQISTPNGMDIEGQLSLEFAGKVSLSDERGFSSLYADLYYTSYTNNQKVLVAQAVYTETEGTNGVGTIKILINNEANAHEYVMVIRDNMFVMMIESLYNAKDKAEYSNYEAQINAMFTVIENNTQKFELQNIKLQDLFQNIFFNDEFKETDTADADLLNTINFVNVEKAALADKFVKDGSNYYKVIADAPTAAEALEEAGSDYVAGDIVKVSGGKYDGRFVAYAQKDSENYAYTIDQLYTIYASGKVASVFPTEFVLKNLLGTINDVLSVSADNAITISSADGLWETLFKYAGPASAFESAYLGNVADEYGYEEMGIISTIATYSGDSINGYEGASNAEELYASIYKSGKGAIRRLTDAGILPGIKLVAADAGKGTYGYATTDVDQITIIEGGDKSFNIEYTYDAVDGKNVFYQTGSTLTKEQAVLLWRVTAGNATVEEVNGLRAEYGAAALATAQDAIDSCYEEGVVNVLGKMFAGSGLVADCYEEGKLDGQKFFDKLLALDAEIVIAPTAKDLTLTVAIKDGSATIASASLNFTVSTANADVTELANNITAFNTTYDAAAAGFTFDMGIWMPY